MARSMLTHVRANAVSYVALLIALGDAYAVVRLPGVKRDADIAIAGVDLSTTAAPQGEASAMSDSRSRECGAAATSFRS